MRKNRQPPTLHYTGHGFVVWRHDVIKREQHSRAWTRSPKNPEGIRPGSAARDDVIGRRVPYKTDCNPFHDRPEIGTISPRRPGVVLIPFRSEASFQQVN